MPMHTMFAPVAKAAGYAGNQYAKAKQYSPSVQVNGLKTKINWNIPVPRPPRGR